MYNTTFMKFKKRCTGAGAYKDGPEIKVARPILSFFFCFCRARPIRAVQNFLTRPLMQKNVFWPVLICAPCTHLKNFLLEKRTKVFAVKLNSWLLNYTTVLCKARYKLHTGYSWPASCTNLRIAKNTNSKSNMNIFLFSNMKMFFLFCQY